MSTFAEAVADARAGTPPSGGLAPRPATEAGREVQLSVRLPDGLRSAVGRAAGEQGLTVTAFVQQALVRALAEAGDSFVGLSDELARNVRAELRAAVQDGSYRQAADDIERQEAWS